MRLLPERGRAAPIAAGAPAVAAVGLERAAASRVRTVPVAAGAPTETTVESPLINFIIFRF